MFENVDGRADGRRTDGRTTDARVTGILIAHLGAFGSGELKIIWYVQRLKCSNFQHYTCRHAELDEHGLMTRGLLHKPSLKVNCQLSRH